MRCVTRLKIRALCFFLVMLGTLLVYTGLLTEWITSYIARRLNKYLNVSTTHLKPSKPISSEPKTLSMPPLIAGSGESSDCLPIRPPSPSISMDQLSWLLKNSSLREIVILGGIRQGSLLVVGETLWEVGEA